MTRIKGPGLDRMVVFQNYSLLPWCTVRENIVLVVDTVMADRPRAERQAIVEEHIHLVGSPSDDDQWPCGDDRGNFDHSL